jgi:hypothetical protein
VTLLAERSTVGAQAPRLCWLPECDDGEAWDFSAAEECVAWAQDELKVELDEWQKLLLRWMLARRPDGRWVCAEFALVISRQNGKSLVLLIRCLFGIVKLGERKTVFSAHLGDTIAEMYRSAKEMLRNTGLTEGPGQFWQAFGSAGREEIQFHSLKASMRFKTRTKSGGRGLTGDTVVLDEAQELRDEQMEAITSILGSKSMTGNPQILFAGSAGNFESTVFARVRRRGIAGGAARLGFAEWSIDDDAYFAADTFDRERIVGAVESFAQANPTFGVVRSDGTGGISEDYLRDEIGRLSPAGFAREHLGVGTWPEDEGFDWVIPRLRWTEAADANAKPSGRIVLALSASWGDRTVAIGAASGYDGEDAGALCWLERLDRGTAWVVDDVKRLVASHDIAAVLIDAGGPAGPLADPVELRTAGHRGLAGPADGARGRQRLRRPAGRDNRTAPRGDAPRPGRGRCGAGRREEEGPRRRALGVRPAEVRDGHLPARGCGPGPARLGPLRQSVRGVGVLRVTRRRVVTAALLLIFLGLVVAAVDRQRLRRARAGGVSGQRRHLRVHAEPPARVLDDPVPVPAARRRAPVGAVRRHVAGMLEKPWPGGTTQDMLCG